MFLENPSERDPSKQTRFVRTLSDGKNFYFFMFIIRLPIPIWKWTSELPLNWTFKNSWKNLISTSHSWLYDLISRKKTNFRRNFFLQNLVFPGQYWRIIEFVRSSLRSEKFFSYSFRYLGSMKTLKFEFFFFLQQNRSRRGILYIHHQFVLNSPK